MNKEILRNHLQHYQSWFQAETEEYSEHFVERDERKTYYQSWTKERLRKLTPEDLYEFMAKLWAMLIWGNKKYVVDKLITDNGLEGVREGLLDLMWGSESVGKRWDRFRKKIKGMGPAMMSEILCHAHPDKCMIWNRRALVGMHALGVPNLPRYNYQLTGARYEALSQEAQKIAAEMKAFGLPDHDLLAVDYFLWQELQVEENLSNLSFDTAKPSTSIVTADKETSEFIHNEIRDKIRDIGIWLGFRGDIEIKVSEGSKVDAVWEASIGNMGRVIYVFEVQTKGSIDSLLLNLLKSLKNPAVQGVVAVSDKQQIEKIKGHSHDLEGLATKIKYWDYEDVIRVHECLETVNESINKLGLVPDSFKK
ncbi:MAG TPA: hypothetical protein VF275_13245 [Gammaproteobacteria bacterium]